MSGAVEPPSSSLRGGQSPPRRPAPGTPLRLTVLNRTAHAGQPAGADDLRWAFRRHAAGVAIVTAPSYDGPVGFTATSLASVSADPPQLSFNLARTSSSWPALSVASHVGVHLLGEDQVSLAVRFSTSGIDRFAAPTRWAPGPLGVPLLDGCATWLVAAVEQRLPAADHVIVVARVLLTGGAAEVVDPLVYHDGGFRATRPRPAR